MKSIIATYCATLETVDSNQNTRNCSEAIDLWQAIQLLRGTMLEEILSGGIFAAARQVYDIVLIILFVFGVITGILATNQGRRFWLWFWVGFLLGPFGLILTLRVVGLRPRPPAFACLSCGRSVRTRGSRCPECGKLLAGRESDRATKLGREAAGAAFLVRRALGAARRRRPGPPRDAGD